MKKEDINKIFIDEINDRPPKKIYPTNKVIVKSIDDNWSLDLLDLIDYNVKNNRSYCYILVLCWKLFKVWLDSSIEE